MTPRSVVYITTTRTVAGVSDPPQLSAAASMQAGKNYLHRQAKQYASMGYRIEMNRRGNQLKATCGGVVIEIEVG